MSAKALAREPGFEGACPRGTMNGCESCGALNVNLIHTVKRHVELSLMRTDAKQLMCILMREYYGMKSYICRVKP
jgi:hypothetical protein